MRILEQLFTEEVEPEENDMDDLFSDGFTMRKGKGKGKDQTETTLDQELCEDLIFASADEELQGMNAQEGSSSSAALPQWRASFKGNEAPTRDDPSGNGGNIAAGPSKGKGKGKQRGLKRQSSQEGADDIWHRSTALHQEEPERPYDGALCLFVCVVCSFARL